MDYVDRIDQEIEWLETERSFIQVFLKWGLGLMAVNGLGWLVVEMIRDTPSIERSIAFFPGVHLMLPAYLHRAYGLVWTALFLLAVVWAERGQPYVGDDEAGGGILIFLTTAVPLLAGLIAAVAAFVGIWVCLVATGWGVWMTSRYDPKQPRELPYVALFMAGSFGPWIGLFNGLAIGLFCAACLLMLPRRLPRSAN